MAKKESLEYKNLVTNIFNFVILFSSFFSSAVYFNNSYAASLPDFTEIIEKNSPAVVNISTARTQKDFSRLFRLPPGMEGTPHGELFKRFFEEQSKPSQESLSLGSGTVVSSDGYIVTNNHVISEADRILVKLSDKREFPAKVIGADKGTDLALLKINAKDLPFVKLGDSDKLKVGEWLVAIGSPFGFEYSATAGIASAKSRSIGQQERFVPFIQTDVAINPGNSGGPLFNLAGEVIGINAQILSKSGGYLGLSFAIPANVVRNVVTQLKEQGYVSRGWLGISFQEIDRDLAKSFGLDRATGALVASVMKDSPAAKSGIKTGDIILTFNGIKVVDASQLPALVGNMSPNTKAQVKIFRDGKEQSMALTIGQLEPEEVSRFTSVDDGSDIKDFNKMGILTRDLNKEERDNLELPEGGVIITRVKENSIAEDLGLSAGDVIISINQKDIVDNQQFSDTVNGLPVDKLIPILVTNEAGIKRYFAFKITK